MAIQVETSTREQPSVVHPSAALRGADGVVARVADFAELASGAPALRSAGAPPAESAGPQAPLDRLFDVTVTVTAELGRVTLPISEVLNLNVNSVLELNRSVSEPVDLMVQGVLLARGEVVVVEDCFAIRIKEIAEPKKRT